MTPRELREMQSSAQLEMFYRLSVKEAVEQLWFLLEEQKKKEPEECQG